MAPPEDLGGRFTLPPADRYRVAIEQGSFSGPPDGAPLRGAAALDAAVEMGAVRATAADHADGAGDPVGRSTRPSAAAVLGAGVAVLALFGLLVASAA